MLSKKCRLRPLFLRCYSAVSAQTTCACKHLTFSLNVLSQHFYLPFYLLTAHPDASAYGSSRCLSLRLIQMPQRMAHPDASVYAHPDASAYGSSRCLSLRLIQMPQLTAHPDASAYGSSRCLSVWLIQMPQLTAHPDASAYGSSRCLSIWLIQMPQLTAHPDVSAYGSSRCLSVCSSRCLSLRLIQMPQCMAHPDASAIAYNSSFFLLVEERSNYSLLLSLSIVLPKLCLQRGMLFSVSAVHGVTFVSLWRTYTEQRPTVLQLKRS